MSNIKNTIFTSSLVKQDCIKNKYTNQTGIIIQFRSLLIYSSTFKFRSHPISESYACVFLSVTVLLSLIMDKSIPYSIRNPTSKSVWVHFIFERLNHTKLRNNKKKVWLAQTYLVSGPSVTGIPSCNDWQLSSDPQQLGLRLSQQLFHIRFLSPHLLLFTYKYTKR